MQKQFSNSPMRGYDKFSGKNYYYLILILGLIVSIPCLSMDIYLPAMPMLTKDLHTVPGNTKLTLSVFLAGLAFGQLFVGVLADVYGRKKILLVGLAIYLVMLIVCALTSTISLFVIARFIQGIGVSATTIYVFATARDVFEGKQLAKTIGYISSLLALAPIIAPLLGGYIAALYGWRAIFIFLFILAVILLSLSMLLLKETCTTVGTKKFEFKMIFLNYQNLVKNKNYIRLILVTGLIFASFFAFLYNISFILQGTFNFSLQKISYIIMLNAFGLFLGSFLSTKIIQKFIKTDRLIKFSFGFMMAASLIMSIAKMAINHYPIYLFCIPMFFCTVAIAMILPISTSEALSLTKTNFGSATAFLSFFRFGLAALMGLIIATFNLHSVETVGFTLFLCALLSYLLLPKFSLSN